MPKYLSRMLPLLMSAALGCSGGKSSPPPAPHAGSSASAVDGGALDAGDAAAESDAAAGAGRDANTAGRAGSAGTAAVGGAGKAGRGGANSANAAGATAAGSGGAGGAADLSGELFDQDKLPRFDIDISSDGVAALKADPATYVRATLHYGAVTLENVGLRLKGEASLRTLDQKAALKLKLDEFVPNQTLLGMHRVTLNNVVSDPSWIAERLAYQVYLAAGIPAPRCNSALAYVNGDFFGVYANVEAEDKPFLRRWFASDAGNLYEDGQVDLEPGNEKFFDLETNETANDRSDLTGLIASIAAAGSDTYLADLDSVFDTEHYLHFAALEAAVDQWDMYSYTYFECNNFRLYHDPSRGKFVFLPWGMDMAMKPFPFSTRAHIPLFEVSRYEDLAPGQDGARDAGGLIFKKCLASASCKTRYAQVVKDIIAVYEAQNLESVAAHHYAQVKDYVYQETRKECTNQQFEDGYQSLLTTVRTRTAAMRSDLSAAGF
jgi:spore coat protein H